MGRLALFFLPTKFLSMWKVELKVGAPASDGGGSLPSAVGDKNMMGRKIYEAADKAGVVRPANRRRRFFYRRLKLGAPASAWGGSLPSAVCD